MLNNVLASDICSSLLTRLAAGDYTGAGGILTTTVNPRYQTAFMALGAQWPSLVENLGTEESVEIGDEYAEVLVTRPAQGKVYGYRINLLRDGDGVWRIDGM